MVFQDYSFEKNIEMQIVTTCLTLFKNGQRFLVQVPSDFLSSLLWMKANFNSWLMGKMPRSD